MIGRQRDQLRRLRGAGRRQRRRLQADLLAFQLLLGAGAAAEQHPGDRAQDQAGARRAKGGLADAGQAEVWHSTRPVSLRETVDVWDFRSRVSANTSGSAWSSSRSSASTES